jgi:hypothetical protein
MMNVVGHRGQLPSARQPGRSATRARREGGSQEKFASSHAGMVTTTILFTKPARARCDWPWFGPPRTVSPIANPHGRRLAFQ